MARRQNAPATSSRPIESSDGPRAGLVIGEEVFDAAKLTGKPGLCDACSAFSRTGKRPKAR